MSVLSNRSETGASGPAERFIDASSRILDKVIGSTGQQAQKANNDLVETELELEHTSVEQLAAMMDLIKRTQANLEVSREKLQSSAQDIADYVDYQQQVLMDFRETTGVSKRTLETIAGMKDPAEEKRARYLLEMEERNRDFERRLRKHHEEFSQMHAQRLAKVLQKRL
ncbi:hypothetical protein GGF40_004352 [Coemansia sp. RSA 1286]|nr:hypothetical protein GGF39_003461 [Coemansia sp. RSA 1721]KAJ2634192.1 hypothetical protein GGF40_004352 [Coemansia sp. RSA 1286]